MVNLCTHTLRDGIVTVLKSARQNKLESLNLDNPVSRPNDTICPTGQNHLPDFQLSISQGLGTRISDGSSRHCVLLFTVAVSLSHSYDVRQTDHRAIN
jgi:hypothetical protein